LLNEEQLQAVFLNLAELISVSSYFTKRLQATTALDRRTEPLDYKVTSSTYWAVRFTMHPWTRITWYGSSSYTEVIGSRSRSHGNKREIPNNSGEVCVQLWRIESSGRRLCHVTGNRRIRGLD